MAIEALLYLDARASQRRRLQAPATMRQVTGEPIDVVIDNLSRHGFHMTTGAELVIADRFSIGIAGAGRSHAHAVRRTTTGYGCMFAWPITSHAVLRAGAAEMVDYSGFRQARDEQRKSRLSKPFRLMIVVVLGTIAWGLLVALLFVVT